MVSMESIGSIIRSFKTFTIVSLLQSLKLFCIGGGEMCRNDVALCKGAPLIRGSG